jgi:hypothetical protein
MNRVPVLNVEEIDTLTEYLCRLSLFPNVALRAGVPGAVPIDLQSHHPLKGDRRFNKTVNCEDAGFTLFVLCSPFGKNRVIAISASRRAREQLWWRGHRIVVPTPALRGRDRKSR